MFEFKDDKLGKVKVVNVTEARGSIASIMGDKDANYVITKNNRPIRVVIDYDFFRQVNSSARSQKPADVKGQYAKDPVKGLLQSKTEELKKQMEAAQQRRPDLFPPASYFQLPELMDEPSPVETPASPPLAEEGQVAEELTVTAEAIQIVEEAQPPEVVREEEIPAPLREGTTVSHETELQGESAPPKDTIEEIAQALRTPPPRGDYFDSYRKLYETPRYEPLFQSNHTMTGHTAINPPVPVSQTMASHTVANHTVANHSEAKHSVASRNGINSTASNPVGIRESARRISSLRGNRPTEMGRQSQPAEPAPKGGTEPVQPRQGVPPRSGPSLGLGPAEAARSTEPGGSLPSIQDLLSELGKISLSGEEEQKAS